MKPAELRALLAKASDGPWNVTPRLFLGTGVIAPDMDLVEHGPLLACWSGGDIGTDRADANAALIAAMRNALPSLLDRIAELEGALERSKAYVVDALEAHEHSDGRDLLNDIRSLLP